MAGALALASLALAFPAQAAPPGKPAAAVPVSTPCTLLPTLVAEGDKLRPVRPGEDLASHAAGLDDLLAETAQDLGLSCERPASASDASRLREAELLERARVRRGPVFLPSLRALPGGEVELRVALADTGARALVVRRERVAAADLPLRAVVLLRDLVKSRTAAPGSVPTPAPTPPARAAPWATVGRISLLANTTVFGGLVGFSIQRASGSDDPRLLYPLLAVGAGVGFGAAIVASGEWNVSAADAWYFASGLWWPSVGCHLLYEGRFRSRPETDRWVFGLLGGTAGATLATLGLALHPASDAGAILAHSGGGIGLVLGGLTEIVARGNILQQAPFAGMGYGANLGWLAAAAAATFLRTTPWRVLAFDLGAVLGGLAGAAAGSPLLLKQPTADQQRAWAGISLGGAVGGAVAGVLVSRRLTAPNPKALKGMPMMGVLGESAIGELRAPIVGAGWSGRWE